MRKSPRDNFTLIELLSRHGRQLGSNHLFLDGHVGPLNLRTALWQIDPWDFADLPKIDRFNLPFRL